MSEKRYWICSKPPWGNPGDSDGWEEISRTTYSWAGGNPYVLVFEGDAPPAPNWRLADGCLTGR